MSRDKILRNKKEKMCEATQENGTELVSPNRTSSHQPTPPKKKHKFDIKLQQSSCLQQGRKYIA